MISPEIPFSSRTPRASRTHCWMFSASFRQGMTTDTRGDATGTDVEMSRSKFLPSPEEQQARPRQEPRTGDQTTHVPKEYCRRLSARILPENLNRVERARSPRLRVPAR